MVCIRGLVHDPHEGQQHTEKSACFTGEYETAVEDYTRVLAVDPENTDALFQRGTAHEKRGAIDAAVADFTAVIGLDSMHAKALYARGACYNLRGEFARAVGTLAALQGSPFGAWESGTHRADNT